MYKKRHLFLFLFLLFVLFGCNKTEKLSIEVEETFVELLLVQECEYKFDYKTNKEAVVDISCDKMTGYLLCDDVVTFSEADTYTFTLLAKNDKETASVDVIINVIENLEIFIDDVFELDLIKSDTLILEYEVSPKSALVEFKFDTQSNIILDENKIKFSEIGVYDITIVASIGDQKVEKQFKVDVYETINLDGKGTLENPYKIYTAADLKLISDTILNEDTYFENCYFVQMNDIDLIGFPNWVPIGTIGIPFAGNYDGNNYKVENINIETSESFQGLFGFLTGTVSNLSIYGSIKVTLEDMPYSHSFVGGIAGGMNNGGQIINCTNYATVIGDSYVGGIVGEVLETDYYLYGQTISMVKGCENYGAIFGSAITAKNENAMYFGGIAGRSNGKIVDCKNYGEIDCDTYATYGNYTIRYVGGIVGYSYLPFKSGSGPNEVMDYVAIENCENYGNVYGPYGVGGIVGQQVLDVKNCINEGKVVGENSVGGIAGISGSSGSYDWCPTDIIECTNNGNIYCSSRNVGGIVGYSYSDVTACVNNASVLAVNEKTPYYMGGIVGTNKYGTIQSCINNGKVETTNESSIIGGIVGDNYSSNVKECTNNGIIKGYKTVGGIIGRSQGEKHIIYKNKNSTNAEVVGNNCIGGIIGRIEAGTNQVFATLSECVNESDIVGETGYIGGIVGMHGSYNVVEKSQNYGAILGKGYNSSENIGVGGISGQIFRSSVVRECVNYGNITGERVTGGIVGSGKGTNSTTLFTITDCINEGVVKCDYESGDAWVAGVLGYGSYGLLSNCTNKGQLINTYNAKYVDYIYGKVSNVTRTNNKNLYQGGE